MVKVTGTYHTIDERSKNDPRVRGLGTAPSKMIEESSMDFGFDSDLLREIADEVSEMDPDVLILKPERTADQIRNMAHRLEELDFDEAVDAYRQGHESCDYKATGSGPGSSSADYKEDASGVWSHRNSNGSLPDDVPKIGDPRRQYYKRGWVDCATHRAPQY